MHRTKPFDPFFFLGSATIANEKLSHEEDFVEYENGARAHRLCIARKRGISEMKDGIREIFSVHGITTAEELMWVLEAYPTSVASRLGCHTREVFVARDLLKFLYRKTDDQQTFCCGELPPTPENKQETISAAAIRYEGVTFSKPPPQRHHDIIHSMADLFKGSHKDHFWIEQGFITSEGRFVDRKDACKIAAAAGQIKEKSSPENTLFSEDLW